MKIRNLETMRIIRRIALISLVALAAGFLFRGWFYRHLVTYKSVGLRPNYSATDGRLIDFLDRSAGTQTDPDIDEIIKLSLSITSKHLNFTAGKNDSDPNKLITSGAAHCVGYATFFTTTCNYLLNKHHLAGTWTAKPKAGKLYFLGTDVHQYFSAPFFRDHDFVTIENKSTGEVLAVDPTVNDYLLIDFVTDAR